ncbi:MAG: glycerol-3-phosphate ABC transporter ATP-binding protein [Caldiserica bacterium]|nr:MAG: glycerol-3-phosphate ABC transporter ATP-binding protein [Caldisericota bacterium]
MADVVLKNVSKIYKGGVIGCKNINLSVSDREFCVIVGPSGCGKSTTLRLIAGLEEITEGELYIGGDLVNEIPPKDRDIAMVFQDYALYPHMTVEENMSFGLRLRKYPKDEIKRRVIEAARILEIEHLLSRRPKQLSGGQRQRVALGRAIVRKPKVFLFDEPLSNLDAKLRVQMRIEIKKLHSKLRTTMIYVTHDQVEAMTLGDKIVVMKDGLIQQIDDPLSIYEKPKTQFVAGFIGSPPMNFIRVKVEDKDDYILIKEIGDGFKIVIDRNTFSYLIPYSGKEITLGIRPEDIVDRIFSKIDTKENVVEAEVVAEEPMGSENIIHAKTKSSNLVIRTDGTNRVKMGDRLELLFKLDKLHFFDVDDGKRIE